MVLINRLDVRLTIHVGNTFETHRHISVIIYAGYPRDWKIKWYFNQYNLNLQIDVMSMTSVR